MVLHAGWPQKDRFLQLVKETVAAIPPRPAYYPGAADRQAAAVQAHPQAERLGGEVPRTRIPSLDPAADNHAFHTEFFGSVWAETALEAPDTKTFLAEAVRFANDRLMGTLGCQILVHPATAKELGPALEQAIADLRYGTIAVNAWSGVAFLISTAHWGAFPGHPLEDIQSGRGVVHNAFLLDGTQKSVVRAPFAPFPRCLTLGEVHMSPKPPWFVTHRHGAKLGRLLANFEFAPAVHKLPAIFAAALSG
jgi:aldehyde dehydrogenase (NAD(P)+)